MLESLFYFSTRDRLLVCRQNSKVIKNTLKPRNRVWGSGLNRKILAPSSFCPVDAPVPILFIHLLTHDWMLLWRCIFIWWFIFWQDWSTSMHSISSSSKNWPMASLVLVILPLVINGSLPAAWFQNGQVNKSVLITNSQILLFDVWGWKAGVGGRGLLPTGFIVSIFWRDWWTYPRFQANNKWQIWI